MKNNKPIKPMLATSVNLEELKDLVNGGTIKYPLIVQPKIDGIRCIIKGGKAFSRSGKLLPNKAVQELASRISKETIHTLDGELVHEDGSFNETTKIVMAEDKPIDKVKFFAFDVVNDEDEQVTRMRLLDCHDEIEDLNIIPNSFVEDFKDLALNVRRFMELGFEGTMVRRMDGKYKQGRSTLKQHYLLKIKSFKDDEGTVVGFLPLMKNNNEKVKDELGYSVRSNAKGNKQQMDTLGSILVKWKGKQLRVGTGLNDGERKEIWDNRDKYMGQSIKFKYMEIGMKDLPRHPVFLGFRDDRDLGAE